MTARRRAPAILALALAIAAAGALATPAAPPKPGRKVGDFAFDFALADLQGRPWSLKQLRGRNVVHVVFWASWCVPCMREIPALREAHARFSAKGLQILGVVIPVNQTPQIAAAIARDFEINYPVLFDTEGALMDRYQVYAIPQNYLIGKDGVIRHEGADLPRDYEAMLQRLLAEGSRDRVDPPAGSGRRDVDGPPDGR